MKADIKERNYDSFREAPNGKSKVAVTIEGDTGLLENVRYDDIQAEFPTPLITNYKYYLNGVLQTTVEVTFTNSAHDDVLRARRV